MRNERAKRAESLEAVTHTHTHTPLFRFTEELVDSLERESFNLKKAGKTAQKSCVYLRYKDRLRKLVCLFFVPDSS